MVDIVITVREQEKWAIPLGLMVFGGIVSSDESFLKEEQ